MANVKSFQDSCNTKDKLGYAQLAYNSNLSMA